MKHDTTTRRKISQAWMNEVDRQTERDHDKRRQKYLLYLKAIHAKKKTARDGSPETVK